MTGESALLEGGTAGPAIEPAGRRTGALIGALALHLPLAFLIVSVWAYFTLTLGIPDTPALFYLAGGALIWLALVAVLVKLWASGRADLWEVPLAWLLLGWLSLFVLPLMFWARCRRWLTRSALPWLSSTSTETESPGRVALQIVALPVLSALVVYGPLLAMAAGGVTDEHEYAWGDISFSYPPGFRERDDFFQSNAPPEQIEAAFFSFRAGSAGVLFQVLATEALEAYAGEGDIPDADLEELAEEWGGGFVHEHVAGLPALTTAAPVRDYSWQDAKVWYTKTVVFDVDAELVYWITCQYDDESRWGVEDGCKQVLSTFEVNR